MSGLIQKQEQKRGDKIVLSYPASGRSVTDHELEENARRVAAKLIPEGFGKGGIQFIDRKDRTGKSSGLRAKPSEVAAQEYYPLTQAL